MDDTALVFGLAIAAGIFIVGPISGAIYRSKGGEFSLGYLLGAILGVVGLAIVLVRKPSRDRRDRSSRRCPACSSRMPRATASCPACGVASAAWTFHEGRWWLQHSDGVWLWLDEASGRWTRA